MTDVGSTIAPKSDQLNADDLIAGPITIRITKVFACANSAEQPIAINYDGDNGKPYKPCKSMRRVLVQLWGRDGVNYIGRRLTLYRDPTVRFGGIEVGGIRISHMSDIDGSQTMALTATRASRKPFTVKPLAADKQQTSAAAPPPPASAAGAADVSSPPADASAGQFTYTLTDAKGAERTTQDGKVWGDTLISLIEKKPFDSAQRAWLANKEHVEAAHNGTQETAEHATRVEAAWRRAESAAKDPARGG